jgi:hypothetical protein
MKDKITFLLIILMALGFIGAILTASFFPLFSFIAIVIGCVSFLLMFAINM